MGNISLQVIPTYGFKQAPSRSSWIHGLAVTLRVLLSKFCFVCSYKLHVFILFSTLSSVPSLYELGTFSLKKVTLVTLKQEKWISSLFWRLQAWNHGVGREQGTTPGQFADLWCLAGNRLCSLAQRCITPTSAVFFTWCSPCVHQCPKSPFL